MSLKLSCVDKSDENWLAWPRPLRDENNNFTLAIYIRSSTNIEHLARINLVDVENGLTEIVENKNAAEHIVGRAK